eukprot:CAMPEP_0172165182 /NCGR_PEP_ID=MMETSP1050-20130122/8272_1 /TAXON_ID=233186 /ORGANISM="Cryptomonas curvata, Strain CCAP979/52" /LENGTH=284 /DNA_ID=CAMNT_0012835629 /DNA_START=45 /DNA_END=898 /DNA_ORIENTATION=+
MSECRSADASCAAGSLTTDGRRSGREAQRGFSWDETAPRTTKAGMAFRYFPVVQMHGLNVLYVQLVFQFLFAHLVGCGSANQGPAVSYTSGATVLQRSPASIKGGSSDVDGVPRLPFFGLDPDDPEFDFCLISASERTPICRERYFFRRRKASHRHTANKTSCRPCSRLPFRLHATALCTAQVLDAMCGFLLDCGDGDGGSRAAEALARRTLQLKLDRCRAPHHAEPARAPAPTPSSDRALLTQTPAPTHSHKLLRLGRRGVRRGVRRAQVLPPAGGRRGAGGR